MTAAAPVPIETLLQHRAWVRGLALRLVRDTELVDEVEQETWLTSLRRPPRAGGDVRAWLGRVVRSRVWDRLRASESRARHEERAPQLRATPSPAEVVEHAEAHRDVVLVVMDLDEPYRTTVLLRFYEDLPPREVARRMDVPVETVRTRTRRALSRMRERLDARHGGERAAWMAGLLPLAGLRESAGAAGAGTGIMGVIVMTTKTKFAVVAVVALAVGWGASRLAATPGTSSAPGDAVATLEDDLRAQRTKSGELLARADRIGAERDRLARELETSRSQRDALEKRVEELELQAVAGSGGAENLAVKTTDPAPPVSFASFNPTLDETLAGVDWDQVGESMRDILPLLALVVDGIESGTQLPPDKVAQIQNLNAPMVTAAMQIAGKVPGVGESGPFTHPSFMANAMAAVLRSANLPLTERQRDRLQQLATAYMVEDAARAKTYDDRTLQTRKLLDEVRARGEFYDVAFKMMTPAQLAVLHPGSVAGRNQVDLFQAGLQWGKLIRAMKHHGREDFAKDVFRLLRKELALSEAAGERVKLIVREWAEALPEDVLDVPYDDYVQFGFSRAQDVDPGATLSVELFERIAHEANLSEAEFRALQVWPHPLVPFRRGE